MATRFNPLNLNSPQLFGIGLSGIIGRSDKSNLLDLAERCLDKGKVHLILDLSGLSSMGGGGAIILADFQRRLNSEGGEAVFVGAGEVVRHYLTEEIQFHCCCLGPWKVCSGRRHVGFFAPKVWLSVMLAALRASAECRFRSNQQPTNIKFGGNL